MKNNYDIEATAAKLANNRPAVTLSFSSPHVEVMVWLSLDEVVALRRVTDLKAGRKSLTLGVSANSKVHWSQDEEGRFYVVVGDDDQTWDVALTLTREEVEEAVAEAIKVCRSIT